MELYYSPGACSLGIHILLEEIGTPYNLHRLNLAQGEHLQSSFVSVNPKSKVPTLVDSDGWVITEFPVIAWWLTQKFPLSRLLPDDLATQARSMEVTEYLISTIHMQGLRRIFRPAVFSVSRQDHNKIREDGLLIVNRGLIVISQQLNGRAYMCGRFSIADTALFYVEYSLVKRLGYSLPPNCDAHYNLMLQRDSVRSALKREGLPA